MKKITLNPIYVIKNKKGALTLDFLFAMVMALSFTSLLFAMSFTMSIVEIAQYISFSSARNYYAANVSEAEQQKAAELKFKQLSQQPIIKTLFNSGWFKLNYQQSTNFKNKATDPTRDVFAGTELLFSADILKTNFPMIGAGESADRKYQATISSYLGREPTLEEVKQFEMNRWQYIQSLGYNPQGARAPVVKWDNG